MTINLSFNISLNKIIAVLAIATIILGTWFQVVRMERKELQQELKVLQQTHLNL